MVHHAIRQHYTVTARAHLTERETSVSEVTFLGFNRPSRCDSRPASTDHETMPSDYGFGDEVTTAEEFSDALSQLLSAAAANGVDVSGSWVHRDGAVQSDWEIMVVELERD